MGSGQGFSMDILRLPADIFAPLLRSLVVTAGTPLSPRKRHSA